MAKKVQHPAPIPIEMLESLRKWVAAYGEKKWQDALRTAWLRGADRNPYYSHHLQQLRNRYGTGWLLLVKADLSNVLTIDAVVQGTDGNTMIVSHKTEVDREPPMATR